MFLYNSRFEPSKGGAWYQTEGAYITRAKARRWKREYWENRDPNNTFRIRKYEVVSED